MIQRPPQQQPPLGKRVGKESFPPMGLHMYKTADTVFYSIRLQETDGYGLAAGLPFNATFSP